MQLASLPNTLMAIPSGVEGIRETLRIMSRLVKEGKKNISVRLLAGQLTRNLPQKHWSGEVNTIFDFVQNNIRYVRDINGVETLHTPETILSLGYGDCDDKSVLLASLLESIGHPTRFKAIALSQDNYCHVYVETKIGDKWIPLDTTEPHSMGWEPDNIASVMLINN